MAEPTHQTDHVLHLELERAAAAEPDRDWISFGGEAHFSFGEILARSRRLAAGLQGLGLQPGDRVGLALDNRVEFVVGWFAAQIAGAVVVPMNIALRGDVLAHMLDLSAPRFVIVDAFTLPRIERALAGSVAVGTFVRVDSAEEGRGAGARPIVAYERISADGEPIPVVVDSHDEAAIMFTSGTTGPAKGVVWTHRAAWHFAEVSIAGMGYRREDILHTCLPLFHANGLCISLLSSLLVRCRLTIGPRFSVSGFWREVGACEATATTMLGSMASLLLKRDPGPEERSHSLRTALVAPAPSEYRETFPRRFGVEPVDAYGLTDFGMLTFSRPGDAAPPGSCGSVVDSFEMRIVDERGEELPRGRVGEAVARPLLPGIAPTGYWRMPEETLASRHDFWFHTGDAMRQDEAGWFFFVGRNRETIRRRGENISSYEIESTLLDLAGIEACAAYAVSSELAEDEVAVAVVLEPACELKPEAILEAIQGRLPYFAVPRYVRMLRELPRHQTKGVDKEELSAEGITEDSWDREAAGFELER